MIFGKKIPAQIIRNNAVVFPSDQYPIFTVREFLGVIQHQLQPEFYLGQPFGEDPANVRVVLADWPNGLVDDNPIVPQGTTLNYKGRFYAVLDALPVAGDHIEIYVRVTPVPGIVPSV